MTRLARPYLLVLVNNPFSWGWQFYRFFNAYVKARGY